MALAIVGLITLVLALPRRKPQTHSKSTTSPTTLAAAPDATVRIDNPGLTYGNLCAMIYVFDADQQLTECCGCVETHNGLRTLSVRRDLTSNPLTGVPFDQWRHQDRVCRGEQFAVRSDFQCLSRTANLRAWVTHIQNPVGTAYPITETESSDSTLGATELANLQAQCDFVNILGSGHGICSCGTGDYSLTVTTVACDGSACHHALGCSRQLPCQGQQSPPPWHTLSTSHTSDFEKEYGNEYCAIL